MSGEKISLYFNSDTQSKKNIFVFEHVIVCIYVVWIKKGKFAITHRGFNIIPRGFRTPKPF